MIDRKRRIDVNKLTNEQLAELEAKLSEKVSLIVNTAVKEANKYLNVYGLEARMHLEIGHLGEFTENNQKNQSKL